jgi:hypothetical protein
MKFNKWTFGLAAVAAVLCTSAVRAQTVTGTNLVTVTSTNASGGTTTVTMSAAQLEAALGLPAGAQLPAFNPAGLDFTNVNYKAGTGMEYLASGGVASDIEGDWDFHHSASVDLGVAGNVALSGTSSGFQSGAIDFELIKNFSNFQLAGQAGIGGVFEGTRSVYGEENLEINYNLAQGTGLTFLGGSTGSSMFTYVFGKVSLQENGGTGGNWNFSKLFAVGAGVAF